MNNGDFADVVIVGAGVGGGTAAHALTLKGFNVVLLEKGEDKHPAEFIQYDEVHFGQHNPLNPSPVDDPNRYVAGNRAPRDVLRWWVANMVGGSSMIWESNLIRYTTPDFKPLETLGCPVENADMPDWPWDYRQFEPFYERAEYDWGVSGKTNQSPTQETFRDGYEYPMPPLAQHPGDAVLTRLLNAENLFPYQAPKGINSEERDGRPACVFCGFCQGYGCAVNDRANARNTVVKKAVETGRCDLRTGHCVTRVVHENGTVRGVYYKTTHDGDEQFIGANKVIVATQADQSARLFLLSDIPDPNQMIGHYLTYHTKGTLEVVFPHLEPWSRSRPDGVQPVPSLGTLQIRDLYTIDTADTDLRIGGKFSVYDPYTVGTPISTVARTGLWGEALIERLKVLRSQPGAGFSFTGISLSNYDNRVELDPEVRDPWGLPVVRSHYQHHDYDIELSNYALDYLGAALERRGAEIINRKPQGRSNAGYGHMHGTLRAGSAPASSVLDEHCQSRTVNGLYALDASWMPTSGASNPSLTIMANAYRVCETFT